MSADRKKNPAEIQQAFDELLGGFSPDEVLEQEGRMIGFAFLSEVEQVLEDRRISRSALARDMGVSRSFITQLFTGDKPLSDKHKAMFQRALGIRFTVNATAEADYHSEPDFEFPDLKRQRPMRIAWTAEPDYGMPPGEQPAYNENIAA